MYGCFFLDTKKNAIVFVFLKHPEVSEKSVNNICCVEFYVESNYENQKNQKNQIRYEKPEKSDFQQKYKNYLFCVDFHAESIGVI